ncbi:MAG: hypothetical protein HQL15_08570 [Candidatus Omnitrophica bacterium]|nr:hypothetical protein [Candidatus Omnitrophota bacterium]
MNIFGLTPIDAALSAWGLTVSLKWTEFLFVQSALGVVALAMGFLWSLWESARNANFKYFSMFVFIALTGSLLFLGLKRQEPVIKSMAEGSVSAQSIKETLTQETQMPYVLTFFSQTADALSIDLIGKIDVLLGTSGQFLKSPFGIQKLSWAAHQWIHRPVSDGTLRRDLDNFIYEHYLPSVAMYSNANEGSDLTSLSMEDARVLSHYSASGQGQWENIKGRLLNLINDTQGPWVNIKEVFGQMGILNEHWEDDVLSSIVRGEWKPPSYGWVDAASMVFVAFPYLEGWANFCLFAAFPFLMLTMLIFRRLNVLLRYVEIFVWVKSWMLGGAVAYWVSLAAAYIQGQSSTQAVWFWEYPYYLTIGAALLILMPIVSFIGIHQCFQWCNRS